MRDAGGMHSLQKQGLLISPTTFELVSRPKAHLRFAAKRDVLVYRGEVIGKL